jgi:sugar-specific transcriptional regulator TrmB
MSDKTGITINLQKLGLNELEARIYASLIDIPSQTALQLSRSLAIPRTSVYDTLVRLGERGLITRLVKTKSTAYKASPISAFTPILKQQQDHIESMSSALSALESQLKTKNNTPQNTEVRYYQGAEGMRQMIWNSLRAEREIVGYSVFGRVDVVGEKFYNRYVEEFRRRSLVDRAIANPTARTISYINKNVVAGKHQQALDNIRLMPTTQLYISGDTTIYNNTYAVCYWQGHEVVGIEIENSDYVRHELSIFNLLWDQAEVIRPNSVNASSPSQIPQKTQVRSS